MKTKIKSIREKISYQKLELADVATEIVKDKKCSKQDSRKAKFLVKAARLLEMAEMLIDISEEIAEREK